MREFLKGLELDKETIDTIMAEHGKLVTEDKEKIKEYDDKIKTYETKIEDLEKLAGDSEKIQEELEELKTSIAEKEAQAQKEAEEKAFSEQFESLIGDKKFINDYTKQAIINEFKTALSDESNKDKEKLDVFTELTKDRTDIFSNPNSVEIPPTGEVDQTQNKTEIPILW